MFFRATTNLLFSVACVLAGCMALAVPMHLCLCTDLGRGADTAIESAPPSPCCGSADTESAPSAAITVDCDGCVDLDGVTVWTDTAPLRAPSPVAIRITTLPVVFRTPEPESSRASLASSRPHPCGPLPPERPELLRI